MEITPAVALNGERAMKTHANTALARIMKSV